LQVEEQDNSEETESEENIDNTTLSSEEN